MMPEREESPDWLRSFQPPTRPVTTLSSSDSQPSADNHNLKQEDETTSTVKPSTKRRVKIDHHKPSKRTKTPPPTRPVTTLSSSDSQPSADNHNLKQEDETTSTVKPSTKRRVKIDHPKPSKRTKTPAQDHSVWALSSDSDSDTHTAITEEGIHDEASKVAENEKPPKKKNKISSPVKREELIKEEEEQKANEASTSKLVKKRKSPLKRLEVQHVESADNNQAKEPFQMEDNHVLGEVGDVDAVEEGLPEKHIQSRVSSSTLALLLPDKVSRCKVLVECEGESIDLSGDMGAVGRVIIPDTSSGEPEMFLDLKGTIYRTTIVPSRTFCVVSVGQSEAKIEAIMNDFVQLKAQSNVYDAETMVEGTLEGFSFDSDDETDKVPKDVKADQNEGAEEQTGKKPKGKQEKKAGGTQKKGKAGGGKQLPKKRKPQATKKSKAKK